MSEEKPNKKEKSTKTVASLFSRDGYYVIGAPYHVVAVEPPERTPGKLSVRAAELVPVGVQLTTHDGQVVIVPYSKVDSILMGD